MGGADPGKYDYYNCEQLVEQRKIAAERELELKLLMVKAEQGPGGAAVNVIAYQGDYLMAREELKVIDAATRGKNVAPEVSDQARSLARSRDATKFGNAFRLAFRIGLSWNA